MSTATRVQPRSRQATATHRHRPSILEPRPNEDPWIKRCPTESCLVLYLHAQPIAIISALPLDLVSLNHRLFELRRRTPRWLLLS